MTFLENLWSLYLDAAPWLLLGLVVAGLLKAWLPEERLTRWLGDEGLWPVVKAALIGAPLPLCSCGVVPAALGLRRAGASNGATVSFLIATPETGPDSIALSYALLGPFMAVVRPVAAVLSAIASGLLAGMAGGRAQTAPAAAPAAGCCASGSCASVESPAGGEGGALARTLGGLRYAVTDILDDIAGWLIVGLVLAAVVMTWVPPLAIAAWGSGLGAMLLMLLVGIPMYICATASTPLAAGLLLAGVSPGAVLVFLLAGPATNIATIGIVQRELGRWATLAYLGGLAASALVMGLATDALVGAWGIDIIAEIETAGGWLPSWLVYACGLVLLAFAARRLVPRRGGS